MLLMLTSFGGGLADLILLAASAVVVGVEGWAFLDAVRRPGGAFTYVGKLDKSFWLIILGLSLAAGMILPPLNFIAIAGLVAALVYLYGIRPQMPSSGGGRSRSSSDGPYGPW